MSLAERIRARISNSYLLLFVLIVLVLVFRAGDLNFIDGRYIWAEDGNIFINQAISDGWSSIFEPYSGYLHLYPRIIANIAIQFDLSLLPGIFFLAWVLAVIYSSVVVFNFIQKSTNSIFIAYFVPLLILLQPHTGETFFNITNAQWFFSIALIVLLVDQHYHATRKNFIILVILGLTGPFSALLLPLIILNVAVNKELKKNYLKYLIIFSTAMIQLYFMSQSPRVGGDIETNIMSWVEAFGRLLTFGTHGVGYLGVLIWMALGFYGLSALSSLRKGEATPNQVNGILLVFALIIVYLAGLWTHKQAPTVLSPLGGGARYFIIPYALMIMSLVLVVDHRKTLYLLLAALCFVQLSLLKSAKNDFFNKSSLDYPSYVWLSGKLDSVIVPIHPTWAGFPGWHINVQKSQLHESNITGFRISKDDINFVDSESDVVPSFKTQSVNAQMHFRVPGECLNSPHLGVILDLAREKDGASQLFYRAATDSFSEANSTRRVYPSGRQTMQFAFPNAGIEYLRLDPSEHEEIIQIESLKIYCEVIVK